MIRTYSKLIENPDYPSRLQYLTLLDNNYNSPRQDSMSFFNSREWRYIREEIIKRDLTFDLAVNNLYIYSKVFVHHINPITIRDIENRSSKLLDPENLVTVSLDTHNLIHYGEIETLPERTPGDTIFW